MAGKIVVKGSGAPPEKIAVFEKAYIEEAAWINEHGQEAAIIVPCDTPR